MGVKTRQILEKLVDNVFYGVQFTKSSHPKYLKKLKKYYDETDLETFWVSFISCLKLPLTIGQKHPHVENTLEFAAKFSVSFYSFSDSESRETMCPFLLKLFEFLLSHHNARDPSVRFRICHFLNMLLNSMGEHAFIDDTLCDQITVCMMERLLDRSPKVRAQAVFALHRLQDPSDPDCPVIKLYVFHLSKDPAPEVRKAVLASMGKNAETLQTALRRTRDTNEHVRKMAFEFLGKITVRSLKMQQRNQLLHDGLKDRCESVQKCVETVLLPSWLHYYGYDYVKLLKALDVELATETSVLTLSTLFRNGKINVLLDQLPIDKSTKLIPTNTLSSENVLYWRCLIQHLQKADFMDKVDTILPELSTFCKYITDFCALMAAEQTEIWEQQTKMFILLQLFEITRLYDLSDEMGRKNLCELILDTLPRDYCTEKIIECIVKNLETVMPDTNNRISALAGVISDIRMPRVQCEIVEASPEQQHERDMQKAKLKVRLIELKDEEYNAAQKKDYAGAKVFKEQVDTLKAELEKLSDMLEPMATDEQVEVKNDRETMVKCLTIMSTMMQAKSITKLEQGITPTLYDLLEMTLESLDHPDDAVHILALKVVGIYCILDKQLAKKHIMMLFLQLTLEQENHEIWVMALKGIFDLLLTYGLEYFDIMQNVDPDSTEQTETSRAGKQENEIDQEQSIASTCRSTIQDGNGNFIRILTGLLDNANQEIRTVAAEGLCKLVLHRRIDGYSLLSRLIILCFNPATDGDVYLRQCLSCFFDSYASHVKGSEEMLEAAFLPTLRIVCNAPEVSPLQEVDPYDIAKWILSLTCASRKKDSSMPYCSHNNLAYVILAELLNPNSKIEKEALIKSLKDLDVQVDHDLSKENLLDATEKVLKMVTEYDKTLVKYVELFKKTLIGSEGAPPEEGIENENS